MTWNQLREVMAEGWDIFSHALTHDLLTSLPIATAQYEIQKSKQWIEENLTGYTVRTFFAPFNGWNDTLEDYARSIGYQVTPYTINRYPYYNTTTNTTLQHYANVWGNDGSHFCVYSHGLSGTTYEMYPWQLYKLINLTTDAGMQWTTPTKAFVYGGYRDAFEPTDISIADMRISFTNNVAGALSVEIALEETDGWRDLYPIPLTGEGFVSVGERTIPSSSHMIVYAGASAETVILPMRVTPDGGTVVIDCESYSSRNVVFTSTPSAVNASVTYSLFSLDSTGYRIYLDGVLLDSRYSTDGNLTFTAIGGGQFEIASWQPFNLIWVVVPMLIVLILLGGLMTVMMGKR